MDDRFTEDLFSLKVWFSERSCLVKFDFILFFSTIERSAKYFAYADKKAKHGSHQSSRGLSSESRVMASLIILSAGFSYTGNSNGSSIHSFVLLLQWNPLIIIVPNVIIWVMWSKCPGPDFSGLFAAWCYQSSLFVIKSSTKTCTVQPLASERIQTRGRSDYRNVQISEVFRNDNDSLRNCNTYPSIQVYCAYIHS